MDGASFTPRTAQWKKHPGSIYLDQHDTDTPHFEQSFSDDGGKTWEVNWITDQTRVKDETAKSRD